ncbi:tRNA 2'-phosphotransferase Ecym_3590 [Eremothecium cymbalariae DBVPG|uniref:2'-phosphotransferase n=1 Tax=Eremothecium cymbalariae (strain CBS 270.75 / DBVPG 7215 / KCTC 17166 / NRRL Y-17582) TaxID=931890 RepID=G8JQS2_ERECY|nr:Hypothetical protein Ecym_3590 [Eremothecium cymbalariae DBVPG\
MSSGATQKRDILISKALSYLLRHHAVRENLPIDLNGYVLVKDILTHNRLKTHKCTVQDIRRIVESNDKRRFHIKVSEEGEESICATQGHSIPHIVPSNDLLERISTIEQLPTQLIHGTTVQNCGLILESGFIKRMKRNHVHLSPGVTGQDKQVISGMRASSTVHIYLNMANLLDKLQLFRSKNNVYLTPNDVPVELFEKIVIQSKKVSDISTNKLIAELERMHIPYETSK